MSQIVVSLGDGHFADNGFESPNNYGVSIGFLTDLLTGADPFRATIPNPSKSLAPEFQPETDPYVPSGIIPQTDLACLFGGCAVPLPDPAAVPEPASLLLVGMALIVAVLWSARKPKEVGATAGFIALVVGLVAL